MTDVGSLVHCKRVILNDLEERRVFFFSVCFFDVSSFGQDSHAGLCALPVTLHGSSGDDLKRNLVCMRYKETPSRVMP